MNKSNASKSVYFKPLPSSKSASYIVIENGVAIRKPKESGPSRTLRNMEFSIKSSRKKP